MVARIPIPRLPSGRDAIRLTLPDLGRETAAEVYPINPGFDPDTRKIAIELAIDGEVVWP